MKKIILSLLILFTITNLQADKIERDKNDPLQNLQIGDKFTISKTTTENETTFDFTGLGIDDNTWLNIYMDIKYIANSSGYIDLVIGVDNTTNLLVWDVNSKIPNEGGYRIYNRAILNSFSKQSFKISKSFKVFSEEIKSTSIAIRYYPYGWTSDIIFNYYLKNTTSSPYELEVVGTKIEDLINEIITTEGDVSGL